MRITGGLMDLQAQRSFTRHVETRERLHVWVGGSQGEPGATAPDRESWRPASIVELSDAALERSRLSTDGSAREAARLEDDEAAAAGEHSDLLVLMDLVERLTGRAVDLVDRHVQMRAGEAGAPLPGGPPLGAGHSVAFDRVQQSVLVEHTSFSASGVVQTDDGRELAFQLDFQMTRVEVDVRHFALRAGDSVRRVDPCVLNLTGAPASLGGARPPVDLDLFA